MINVSFNKGVFPDFLKVANIIPIHKKGEKLDPNIYKPISLFNISTHPIQVNYMKKQHISD